MNERNGESDRDHSEVDSLPLAKGWSRARIASLASSALVGLDRGRASQSSDPIGFPYVKMGNIDNDGSILWNDLVYVAASKVEVERFGIESGDLLFNTRNSRELVGKVGYVPYPLPQPNILFNNNLMRLRFHSDIDSRFICYQMVGPAFRRRLENVKRSTTNVAAIYAKDLLPLTLEVAPVNEQRRIVAKIEELFSDLDAGVAALERAKANLKRYRASVLKAAVEGKLTEEWRQQNPGAEPASKLLQRILTERRQRWEADQLAKFAAAGKQPPKNWQAKYVEPKPPDTTGLPELPAGWCWASFGQLIFRSQNGFGKRRQDKGVATIVLRLADITDGKVSLVSPRSVNATPDEIEKYALEKDDLLAIRVNGSPDIVGQFVRIVDSIDSVLFCDHFIQMRLVLPQMSPFIRILGDTRLVRQFVEEHKVSTAGQNTINQTSIEKLAIPLMPCMEQSKFVTEVAEKFSQIDAAEIEIVHSLQRASRLRQSILKQAFEGKLVPQDPTDEPAKAMLERLRANQTAHVGNGEVGTNNRPTRRRPAAKKVKRTTSE